MQFNAAVRSVMNDVKNTIYMFPGYTRGREFIVDVLENYK